MRVSSFTLPAVLLASVPSVIAWGAAGHEIVATIAQIHLEPSVIPKMCEILNFTSTDPRVPECHLAPFATWADRLKYRMRWSANLHYVGSKDDFPSTTCAFPGEHGWAGPPRHNVLSAIRNVTGLLEDWSYSTRSGEEGQTDLANEALKFLVHFLGDLHMPLHLTGRDRGGNSDKVRFDGRQSNLHSVWDGLLIAKTLRNVPGNYSHPLPIPQIENSLRGTIYDNWVRQIMWEGILGKWSNDLDSWLACPAPTPKAQTQSLWQHVMSLVSSPSAQDEDDEIICPQAWAAPIHQLNCEIVWPKALDLPPYGQHLDLTNPPQYLELDTPEYAGRIAKEWILEELLAKAGIRLAGIMNYLFADEEESRKLRVLLAM